MYVNDLFKLYQKDLLSTTQKKDYYKKLLANTELFDMTNYYRKSDDEESASKGYDFSGVLPFKDFSLPFENCFIKISEQNYMDEHLIISIFIKEDSPMQLTGKIIFSFNQPSDPKLECSLPFTINIKLGLCEYNINKDIFNVFLKKIINNSKEIIEVRKKIHKISSRSFDDSVKLKELGIIEQLTDVEKRIHNSYKTALVPVTINALIGIQEVFEKLSRCEILVDNIIGTEYYSIKGQPAIKVTNRPIYYVMNKQTYATKSYKINPIAKLEYTHAFKVRGHWRRIDAKSIGKDRYGDYHIYGFTWVIEHMRGQGELVKRTRVIKN